MAATTGAREDLLGGAQIVEMETQGYLPAKAFTKLINKGVLPAGETGELQGFYPINIALDPSGEPTEANNLTGTFATGCLACYEDKIVAAWLVGNLFPKVSATSLSSNGVEASVSAYGDDAVGVDLVEGGRTVSIVFGTSLELSLAKGWANELASTLNGKS